MLQRALVLGASGHIGNAVVRELLAQGCTVTAARRGRTAAYNLAGLPVREVLGDGNDAGILDRWIAGHDLVIDAAAPYPLELADRGAVAASAQRAASLVDAVTRHRSRLIHIGSFVTRLGTDAAGHPRDPGQRLDDEIHPYFAAKRAGETVFAAAATSGAPITIVYPTVCLGPWDSRPTAMCLVPRLLAGELPAVPSHILNVIDVRDAARGVVAAAGRGPHGKPVPLVGHNVGLPELCALIGELAGVPVKPSAIPSTAARAGAWGLELGVLGTQVPGILLFTALALRHMPLVVGAEQRALGAIPRPLSATLRDTIAWYRERPSDGAAAAARGMDASAAALPTRPRRPEPIRTGPRRSFAGVLGVTSSRSVASTSDVSGFSSREGENGQAPAAAGSTATTRPSAWSEDDPVSRAVHAGYDVVEQALRRRGLEAGRDPLWPPSWAAPWMSGPFADPSSGLWTVGRLVDGVTSALVQALQQIEPRSAMAPWAAVRSSPSGEWAKAAKGATSPVAAPVGSILGEQSVAVELRSARAAAVQLSLSPGAGPVLKVYELVASDDAATPPITDVTLTRADGYVRVALGSLEHFPAGIYQGTVLSAGRACGTLMVRLP